jgi:hypothetical protein
MLNLLSRRREDTSSELLSSRLYDEKTFYPAFIKDLSSLDKTMDEFELGADIT